MLDHSIIKSNISGIILAGGKSSRMGKDKGLIKINDQALIHFVISQIVHQVNSISINTNQNFSAYRKFEYPLIKDEDPDRLGPLAGMLSSLNKISTAWAFFCACDIPQLPTDIVIRLATIASQQQKLLAVVHTGDRLQPLCALIHRDKATSIKSFLDNGSRKTQEWQLSQNPAILDCSHQKNAFININTPQQKLNFELTLATGATHGEN